MPRLDGLDATRRIQAERPLPIVILTAFSARSLVAEAVDAGVFAYLVKPFRPQEILCAIETAAARHDDVLHARRALGRKPPEAPKPISVTLKGGDEPFVLVGAWPPAGVAPRGRRSTPAGM